MRITANFDSDSFACHDGTPVPPEFMPNLTDLVLYVLQPLRDVWGGPLIEISGYRTPDWNRRVRGAASSTHLDASGADVRPVRLRDVAQLHTLVLARYEQGRLSRLGGLGLYPGWIHVDTRKAADGHLRRWGGSGMGSEPG